MSVGYEGFLSQQAAPVNVTAGGSGYFAARDKTLDPHLFNGETFKPEVRAWILKTLYDFWSTQYAEPLQWSTVWVAGSGISYQWSADRGNGDLDILIGVDFPMFFRFNDKYLGFSEEDVADLFNTGLKHGLWTQTSHTNLGGRVYEVTFYVNPRSADIRDIHPYAAYNLTADTWTVRPPDEAATRHQDVPQSYWDYVKDEQRHASSIVSRYNQLASVATSQPVNSPGWHNTMRQVEIAVSQAQSMFNDIHLGRRQAFGAGGSGYGDFYNFRWQAHKQAGTVQALHAVTAAGEAARDAAATEAYGRPIDAAEVSLRRAALWNRGGNGR